MRGENGLARQRPGINPHARQIDWPDDFFLVIGDLTMKLQSSNELRIGTRVDELSLDATGRRS